MFQRSEILFEETRFGFIVRPSSASMFSARYDKELATVTAAILGYASVIVFASSGMVEYLTYFAISSMLLVLWMVFFFSVSDIRRRVYSEIRVYRLTHKVVFGKRDARGRFVEKRSISAREIRSAFIVRRKNGRRAVLLLRLKNSSCVQLLSAPEEELFPILKRVISDLSDLDGKDRFSRKQSIALEIGPSQMA